MYSIVKRLRQRGRRMPDREISASTAVQGELVVAICGHRPEATLFAPNDQRRRPLIPELQNVQLLTMTTTGMLLYGTEIGQDGAEYVQEWSVRIIRDSGA
jgi:hypothetical protein